MKVKQIDNKWLSDYYSSKNIISIDESWIKFRHLWNKFNPKMGYPLCFVHSEESNRVSIYFGSQTVKGANSLRQELLSFIGNNTPFFDGLPYELNLNISHENLLSEIFVGPCFRIFVSDSDNIKVVF